MPLIVDVQPSDSERNIFLEVRIEHRIREIVSKGLDLVLVDLCYGPHESEDSVENGVRVALHLREVFYPIPVGVYTKAPLLPRQRILISAEQFALMLENFTSMVEYTGKLSCANWINAFEKVVLEARERASQFPRFQSAVPFGPQSKWAEGQPKSTSPAFRTYAPILVNLALEHVHDISEVVLTQLGGGFSGSYLVKAELPGRPKAYVVKIDEDPKRVQREMDGYGKVRDFINHDHYISPEGPVRTLSPAMWGAFALEYDAKRQPLIDCEPLDTHTLEKLYRELWKDCLFQLYSTPTLHKLRIDSLFEAGLTKSVRKSLTGLSRYMHKLGECSTTTQAAVKWAVGLHSTGALPLPVDRFIGIPWVERVHGDLNCRNVFSAQDGSSFLLIDFPNVDPAPLPTDFVKAEAELTLILLDRVTGCDYDFGRLDLWGQMTGAFAASLNPTLGVLQDTELERLSQPLRTIRQLYFEKAAGMGDFAEAYQWCLVSKLLPYLGYPDISPAKKLLAIVWVGQLLQSLGAVPQ
jgi:hypothetical protein